MLRRQRLWALAALLPGLIVSIQCSTSQTPQLPRLVTNVNKTYILYDEDTICLYASFDMEFLIIYTTGNETKNQNFHLPPSNKMDLVSGECNKSLDLRWTNENGTQLGMEMNFTTDKNQHWTIQSVAFSFVLDNSSFMASIDMDSYLVYRTNRSNTNLLNRTYSLNQYFSCQRCKVFYLTDLGKDSDNDSLSYPCENSTSPSCSTVDMTRAVIYPGNIHKEGITKLICIEDYIALQEIIVPVVVGGILSFLLLVIFVSYVIAYFRRRRKESRQYEPMSGGDM